MKVHAFERSSKRRRGFPSETRVKRGSRVVRGDKELIEKLGRNDPCPCGSGRRFQEVLYARRSLRRFASRSLLLESEAFAVGDAGVAQEAEAASLNLVHVLVRIEPRAPLGARPRVR